MKITKVVLKNYRRLEDVEISLEKDETVFVGPNNSGKTSATSAFRQFLRKPDFRIHDFSASRIAAIDTYGAAEEGSDLKLPSIDMDLWFSIDPDVEYGRVSELLPTASAQLDEVGVRISFCVTDLKKLRADYNSAFPPPENGNGRESLSKYLSPQDILNRHFGLSYFALERKEENVLAYPRKPDDGKRVLKSLVRVDFIDAQRNIDDHEVSRSNKLSSAFATFYRNNLDQADASEEANNVLNDNNENLNKHYDTTFKELMGTIRSLGVPTINDREMRIVSTATPEEALRGTTSLFYVDTDKDHELPEAYNGLGFKNLVYMAIQVSHRSLQWVKTPEQRPLCQIIFIEEPEVHLHAQVQQTFIENIWRIIKKTIEDAGEPGLVPQLGITTHSSHVVNAVDFKKIRYFQRKVSDGEDPAAATVFGASKVLSLREFRPQQKSAAGELEDEKETLDFLRRYLKLTHCDLFFADAAVLVEGTVEKLLMSKMIEKSAPGLRSVYLTVLEVGGAYAHRFASLLEFLAVPYLVLTDLDSIDPKNKRKTCRADCDGAETANAALKFFFAKSSIAELVKLEDQSRIGPSGGYFIAFPQPSVVEGYEPEQTMHGRTFEEVFAYQNIQLLRAGEFEFGVNLDGDPDYETEHTAIYERVKSSSFKKTKFALDVASSEVDWETPQYIGEGLFWLEGVTTPSPASEDSAAEGAEQ